MAGVLKEIIVYSPNLKEVLYQHGGILFTDDEEVYIITSYKDSGEADIVTYKINFRNNEPLTLDETKSEFIVRCKERDLCIHHIPSLQPEVTRQKGVVLDVISGEKGDRFQLSAVVVAKENRSGETCYVFLTSDPIKSPCYIICPDGTKIECKGTEKCCRSGCQKLYIKYSSTSYRLHDKLNSAIELMDIPRSPKVAEYTIAESFIDITTKYRRNLVEVVENRRELATSLENENRVLSTTGKLAGVGKVAGLAGLVAAPFTFGASLAVTAAVTGAMFGGSALLQKVLERKSIKEIDEKFKRDHGMQVNLSEWENKFFDYCKVVLSSTLYVTLQMILRNSRQLEKLMNSVDRDTQRFLSQHNAYGLLFLDLLLPSSMEDFLSGFKISLQSDVGKKFLDLAEDIHRNLRKANELWNDLDTVIETFTSRLRAFN